jgi:TetR/AcrR family transcriptional repressor of bet genes
MKSTINNLTFGTTDSAKPAPSKKDESKISLDRRNALIEGTIQSLAKFGVAGTTISTICSVSVSSRGLIAHYFGSKEVLLAEALKRLYDGVSQSVYQKLSKPELSATQRLTLFPQALFSPSVFTQKNRSVFLCLWHETRFNKMVRLANQDLYRGYVKQMEGLFYEAATERYGKRENLAEQSKIAAMGFIGLSDGLWLGMSIHDKLIKRSNAIAICTRFINNELTAMETSL